MEENIKTQFQIHEKGFDMINNYPNTDYSKIKVGVKTLEDAVLNLGTYKKVNYNYGNKFYIMQALHKRDTETLRDISNFFFNTNGIYARICKYFATMYRYDWYIVPEVYDKDIDENKVEKDFHSTLQFLDRSYITKMCNNIALKVIRDGAYYGYITDNNTCIELQELPIKYCRSRYNVNHQPAIEFDMRFFDEKFADADYRQRVLKLFPKEFSKGYVLYKQGKLKPDFSGDTRRSWYLLDPSRTVKFSLSDNGEDIPLFINALPALLDLDDAQDLDRKKQMQKLLKIVVQKLPLDKNGDLIFDLDEAKDIHNNAVQMLSKAIGVDVLTTFADIESIDMSDKNTTTSSDDLKKIERSAFNNFGISQNLFNTDGNLSLEKSILNDEGSVRDLLLQFEVFFDLITRAYSPNRKKYTFRLYMLETTQYNYKELSKMYKEQVQIGYSKMLPQIALGHSQSSILNTAYFENEILHLSELMIPPLMSSTLSMDDVTGARDAFEEKKNGRPEKSEGEKSDKTLQNEEAMS